MKPMDENFYHLYTEHKTSLEPGCDDVNPMTTYQHVLQKAGLNARRHSKKKNVKVLLIAAVFAAASLTVATAVYSVRDAFRGVLDIHSSADRPAATSSILERTGQLIGQTQKNKDVDLSLRAAVGDGQTLKVLVDVVDHSGKGLAIRQPDKTKSDGTFGLRSYTITKANGDLLAGSSNYSYNNNYGMRRGSQPCLFPSQS